MLGLILPPQNFRADSSSQLPVRHIMLPSSHDGGHGGGCPVASFQVEGGVRIGNFCIKLPSLLWLPRPWWSINASGPHAHTQTYTTYNYHGASDTFQVQQVRTLEDTPHPLLIDLSSSSSWYLYPSSSFLLPSFLLISFLLLSSLFFLPFCFLLPSFLLLSCVLSFLMYVLLPFLYVVFVSYLVCSVLFCSLLFISVMFLSFISFLFCSFLVLSFLFSFHCSFQCFIFMLIFCALFCPFLSFFLPYFFLSFFPSVFLLRLLPSAFCFCVRAAREGLASSSQPEEHHP